jgi:hypothetical protein
MVGITAYYLSDAATTRNCIKLGKYYVGVAGGNHYHRLLRSQVQYWPNRLARTCPCRTAWRPGVILPHGQSDKTGRSLVPPVARPALVAPHAGIGTVLSHLADPLVAHPRHSGLRPRSLTLRPVYLVAGGLYGQG